MCSFSCSLDQAYLYQYLYLCDTYMHMCNFYLCLRVAMPTSSRFGPPPPPKTSDIFRDVTLLNPMKDQHPKP